MEESKKKLGKGTTVKALGNKLRLKIQNDINEIAHIPEHMSIIKRRIKTAKSQKKLRESTQFGNSNPENKIALNVNAAADHNILSQVRQA